MNIFKIQQPIEDRVFVLSLEFELFADILETASDLLYIGSLFKRCAS